MDIGFFVSIAIDLLGVLLTLGFSIFKYLYSLIFCVDGINMASVLDFLPFQPTCTVTSYLAIVLQIISYPIIASSRLLKMLTLSSMYVKRFISTSSICFSSAFLCSFSSSIACLLHRILGIAILLNLNSLRMSSATNCKVIMKSIGAKLSPCLTLQSYEIIISSHTNFSTILKLLYNFSTYFTCLGGAPILINDVDIISYRTLSHALTRSINIMKESIPCTCLNCKMLLSKNTVSAHSIIRVAPNCMGCPYNFNSFCTLTFSIILTIFE